MPSLLSNDFRECSRAFAVRIAEKNLCGRYDAEYFSHVVSQIKCCLTKDGAPLKVLKLV